MVYLSHILNTLIMYQIKEIKDFQGYHIDTNGQLWSQWKPHPKIGWKMSDEIREKKASEGGEYLGTVLCRDGKKFPKRIHTLMLETFVGKRPKGMESRHLDGDSLNNQLSNLKWGTPAENDEDRRKHGTMIQGETQWMSKLTEKQVRIIKWALHYGASYKDLAKMCGVKKWVIGHIKRNETWKHVFINQT